MPLNQPKESAQSFGRHAAEQFKKIMPEIYETVNKHLANTPPSKDGTYEVHVPMAKYPEYTAVWEEIQTQFFAEAEKAKWTIEGFDPNAEEDSEHPGHITVQLKSLVAPEELIQAEKDARDEYFKSEARKRNLRA